MRRYAGLPGAPTAQCDRKANRVYGKCVGKGESKTLKNPLFISALNEIASARLRETARRKLLECRVAVSANLQSYAVRMVRVVLEC